jgi:acetyl-CoA acyltransferase
MEMQEPVIVQALRTPQGKKDGTLADVRSEQLSVPLVNEMLANTGLSGREIDDVMWGCAKQVKEQTNNIARVIALASELGEIVPGTTIDRLCASSAQAIMSATDSIRCGQRQAIIAGGVENMSRVERDFGIGSYPTISKRYEPAELQMGITAEKVAEKYGITRSEQDEYGVRSQQRAVEATENGRFDEEIVPIDNGSETITRDEGLRPGTTIEALADIPPAFKEEGTVHAGNSSQVSDGAAAVMVSSRSFAEDHGLDIMASVGNHNVAGVDPTVMGIGPIPAVQGLWERTGRESADYDLVELNEAFASQTIYCQRELGFDDSIYNVNGGAIAIGHPLGASGARLPVTLIHELRRRGGGLGLATMCVGYGQGSAIEFTVE